MINKKLRAAVSECKHGLIEGYPDLEITNINRVIGDLEGSTETLVVNVDRAVESLRRITKVKEGDGLGPELEELAGPQEAHNTRRSPETSSEDNTRSTSPPPPSSRMQKSVDVDCSASRGPGFMRRLLRKPPEEGGQAAQASPSTTANTPPHT